MEPVSPQPTATGAASAPPPWPSVCLHDHLDGALRPGTVLQLAARIGHELPASDPESLGRWFREAADSGSLERYLETFEHTVAVLQSAEALERVAREYVLDAAADGVLYAEVRWAPQQHTRAGLDPDEAVLAVARGLAAGEREAAARGEWIRVRQLLCAMRQLDGAERVADLALAHRGHGVVGFDLAGPEAGYPPSDHHEALRRCAEHLLPVTLHAGEAAGLESIRSAVVDGRARRLGHGVRLLADVTRDPQAPADPADPASGLVLGELAGGIRDAGIGLEVCPCSNLQTGAAPRVDDVGSPDPAPARTPGEHPVALLRALGFDVLLSPDNRLMSGTSMAREQQLLTRHHGWGREEFRELALTGARHAFLPAGQREELAERIREAYAVLPPAAPETETAPGGAAEEPVAPRAERAFGDLVRIMRRLRSERGCPWDAAQTHASLVKYLLEETHEVIEAIESPERTGVDAALLREELGDVLLQVVFHARIAQESPEEAFDAADVVAGLNAKMIRRHPHVFAGDAAQASEDLPPADAAPTAQERGAAWEELKRREKPERTGPFDGIPPSLPALARAEKILGRAAKAGLDLPPVADPPGPDAGAAGTEEALGEALLGLVVRARQLGVDPEAALRAAVRRYVRRVG